MHPFTYSLDHHGQEIVRTDYACISYGPFVYATDLFDGFRKQETIRLPRLFPENPFQLAEEVKTEFGPAIELRIPGHSPMQFRPYAEAGGRHDSAWRTTWLQVAWQ